MADGFKRTITPPTLTPAGGHVQQLAHMRTGGAEHTTPAPAAEAQPSPTSLIQRQVPDTYAAILEQAQALAKERRQDTEALTLRVSPGIKTRLRLHAAEHGYSHNLSALVEALLDAYLPGGEVTKS